jgi:hypothetical protein
LGEATVSPKKTLNRSVALPDGEKAEHYLQENLFVTSLHHKTYENNFNFLRRAKALGFGLWALRSNRTGLSPKLALTAGRHLFGEFVQSSEDERKITS